MKYFKNIELAKLYHVSEKTVRNWIEATREGKLNLQLHEEKSRFYVANTAKNNALIEQLVQKGKKYKNTRGLRIIVPSKKFFNVYEHGQILDIISNVTIHREIPIQYSYFNGGAKQWDRYVSRLNDEQTSNILSNTVDLLDTTADNVDNILDSRKINLVDLGPGNGMPVRSTLERLLKQNRLNRYIAIDISQEMLDVVETNIKSWFGDAVNFEGHVRDFSYERFGDIFADDPDASANLVFLFGGTLSNFRSPTQVLQTISASLGPDDLFIYSGHMDTPHTRRYFDFDISTREYKIATQERMILDFLNIDQSLYEVELLFSEEKNARLMNIRFNVDVSIKFDQMNRKRCIELLKDDRILLWRHRHYNAFTLMELFDKNNFDLQQITKSKDQNYALLAFKLKVKSGIA